MRTRYARSGELRIAYELRGRLHWQRPWLVLIQGLGFDRHGWDPVTRKRVWSYPYKYVLLASMLATAGDLVFTGNPEGEFFALDARTGAKLWSFQTGAGHRGSAISYSVNGRQYIATPTGWPVTNIGAATQALFPDQAWRNGSTVMVFVLPGGTR